MRRSKILIFSFVCLLIISSGCSKENSEPKLNDLKPMLMVNETIYLDTGTEVTLDEKKSIIKQIVSTVPQSEKPTKDGQSNFGSIGDNYCVDGDKVLVEVNNKWIVFEVE